MHDNNELQNNEDVFAKKKLTFSEKMRIWYSYNKQIIPFFIMIVSVLFVTATIDFNMKGVIQLRSHIDAINRIQSTLPAFYLFVLTLIAIVQVFLLFSFKITRAPMKFFIVATLTIIQIVIVVLYINTFLTEHTRMPSYILSSSAVFSMITMAIGTFLMLVATVFCFIYVDWKYVKVEE